MFWRKRPENIPLLWHRKRVIIPWCLLFGIVLAFRFSTLVTWGNISRFMLITYPFDQQLSKSVTLAYDLMTGKIGSWQNIVAEILEPLTQEKKWLLRLFAFLLPQQYELLSGLAFFTEDINELVGMKSPQTYLIVLQNSAEKRPNWWFFWSFAVVTLDRWQIKTLELHDSYHPEWNRPDTKIIWPVWLEQFMPDREIYFVGANKIWFTYHDWANIKTLYEKSYPGKRIRGVLFLRTDMLEQLLPEIREQFRLRQYLNATVNLREWPERRWKKEAYESGVKAFVQKHKQALVQAFLEQFPQLIQQRYINIYLENISWPLHSRLREQWLTTRFESWYAYFWDSNIIFNKIDQFVTKKITLVDSLGAPIQSWESDIVALPELSPNNLYTFVITYSLAVPDAYHAFMRTLNEKYTVQLWQREEHILWLDHEWWTRWNIYFPPHREVVSIQGDMATQRTFWTPFSTNAAYEVMMPPGSNNQTRTVRIQVMVHDI